MVVIQKKRDVELQLRRLVQEVANSLGDPCAIYTARPYLATPSSHNQNQSWLIAQMMTSMYLYDGMETRSDNTSSLSLELRRVLI